MLRLSTMDRVNSTPLGCRLMSRMGSLKSFSKNRWMSFIVDEIYINVIRSIPI